MLFLKDFHLKDLLICDLPYFGGDNPNWYYDAPWQSPVSSIC